MSNDTEKNKQKKAKSETMVWFRCSISAWKDRKLEALTVPERWFLFQLHVEMVERAQPINDAVVNFLARDQRIRPSTAKSIVEKLVQNGFVYRIGDCLWSNPAEEEYAFRQERTAHKTASNRLAAQKRWEKDKQNQRNAMREEEGDNMGAAHGADAQRDISTSVTIGGDKEISQSEGSPRLSASPSETGEEEAIIPKADEIDLDSNTLPSTPTPEHLDGPHTGDRIEIGEGASIEIAEDDDETPDPDDDDTPFEGDEWDEMIPFDSWSGTPTVAATDTRASNS
jgi:hypothetical protein